MAIPPLVLRIYADSTGVKTGVAQAQAQVSGFRAAVQRNATMIKVGLAAAVVVGLTKATKAASDLAEAQNAANVTFGKSVGIVNRFADAAAGSFGIAKAEALQAAAGFGAMFDSAGIASDEAAKMSVVIEGLAADLGSLRNVGTTEMLDNMRSALAGEAEPLRKFGVFVSEARVQSEALAMGMEAVNGEFTDAQKIQARYNIILEDTQKAHGDFQRTLGESMPNQLKKLSAQWQNLEATLGKHVIPAVTFLLKLLNKMIANLEIMISAVARAAVWFNTHFVQPTIRAFQNLADVVGKGAAFIRNTIVAAWNAVRGPVLAVIHAIVAGVRLVIDAVQTAIDLLKEMAGLGSVRASVEEVLIEAGRLPPRAHGGPVTRMRPYIVGERGPELFVPRQSGTVVPNHELGSSAPQTINLYIGEEKVETVVVRAMTRAAMRAG